LKKIVMGLLVLGLLTLNPGCGCAKGSHDNSCYTDQVHSAQSA
jgi:hypothetical protein